MTRGKGEPKTKRDEDLQESIDELAEAMWGKTQTSCIKDGVCMICHSPANEFKDEISAREFEISGFCQICQDNKR